MAHSVLDRPAPQLRTIDEFIDHTLKVDVRLPLPVPLPGGSPDTGYSTAYITYGSRTMVGLKMKLGGVSPHKALQIIFIITDPQTGSPIFIESNIPVEFDFDAVIELTTRISSVGTGGSVQIQATATGPDTEGVPRYYEMVRNYPRSALAAPPGSELHDRVGLFNTGRHQPDLGMPAEEHAIFDNFRIDWTGYVPPALPCFGYGSGYDDFDDYDCYPGIQVLPPDCNDCEGYALTPEVESVCGITLPGEINTYARSSNVYAAYGSIGDEYMNVAIFLDPVDCRVSVTAVFGDGMTEVVAHGFGAAPSSTCDTIVTMETIAGCSPVQLFGLRLSCVDEV